MSAVGFVGLGSMSGPIAGRLLQRRAPLVLFQVLDRMAAPPAGAA